VTAELWNALGRNIAPGSAHRAADDEVVVPLERFLASRNWLASALETYGVDADLDGPLSGVLARADAERAEVAGALADGTSGLSQDEVAARLRGSRFTRVLRSFQLRDLGRVLALSHGANFSVPGAGKTTVAYAAYEAERMAGRVERMLVVAPLSAFDAWFSEVRECLAPPARVARFEDRAPLGTEILLVNYQRLSSRYGAITEWVLDRPCHVILDEAHRMKRGRGGEWGSRCLDLGHLAVRRDILTGTPAPQHPSDFGALLEFLWPHQSARILPAAAFRPEPPPGTMHEVSGRLRPLFARTNKNELGLDRPVMRVVVTEMKPLQREIYEALRTRMSRAVRASARERALIGELGGVVMYLLEVATNPALLATAIGGQPEPVGWPPDPIPEDSTLAERIRAYASLEVPSKFEKLAALVAANAACDPSRKTLVWSNFVGNLTELAERVLRPHQPALIYGAIPSGDADPGSVTRERELERFREDPRCRVLLANPAAMSEGVSLHHVCHDAVYLDRTFNAGQYLQSLDRIHRLGLRAGTETRITLLVSEGTIDEQVDDRVRVKAARLAAMLNDPELVTMALPDEEAYGAWIDAEDVDALFGHLVVDSS
jgi:SNF2 family DNA or RNA helicase